MKKNPHQATDRLYADYQENISQFTFDQTVADVFPDMIARSVPGYTLTLSFLPFLAQQYVQANTTLYDLGCARGAGAFSIAQAVHVPNCRIIAVDNAAAMITYCNTHPQNPAWLPIDFVLADILSISFKESSFMLLHFTLQFIAPPDRGSFLSRLYDALVTGGAVIISEKLRLANANATRLFQSLHHSFKKANGYSDLEIQQKRTALENTLISDTLTHHKKRLQEAGFRHVFVYFQCLHFVSMVAVK